MANRSAKVAISMPKDLFRAVEQVRRELKIPRSAAIVEAIHIWLKRYKEQEKIRQYVAGYRKYPESREEVKQWTSLTAKTFGKDPWK